MGSYNKRRDPYLILNAWIMHFTPVLCIAHQYHALHTSIMHCTLVSCIAHQYHALHACIMDSPPVSCIEHQYHLLHTSIMHCTPVPCIAHQYHALPTSIMHCTPVSCIARQYHALHTSTGQRFMTWNCILFKLVEIQWIIPNIQFFSCNKTLYCAYIHRVKITGLKKAWKLFTLHTL